MMVGGSLAAALAVATAAVAIDGDQSNWDLSPLVKEAQELVSVAHQQTVALDSRLARGVGMSTGQTGYGDRPLESGGSYEYNDLKRTATRFGDLANRIIDMVGNCSEDSRKIALDFRKRTQRFSSTVRGVANASSSSLARASIPRIEKDLGAIQQSLQGVASLSGCSKQSGDDEKEAE